MAGGRNEKDVTRGRANTLRLAISGQLGKDALTSPEMRESLKHCVSCKACRRECPTGVDMAKMKIEVLRAHAKRHGLSLHDRLKATERLIVAFSGGVDSSYLAYAARSALGDACLAVTAVSPSYPRSHRDMAEQIVRDFEIPHRFVETREMESEAYRANAPDRCFHCKSELFERLDGLCETLGYAAIAYGINTDDTGDFRPGHKAAAEHAVRRRSSGPVCRSRHSAGEAAGAHANSKPRARRTTWPLPSEKGTGCSRSMSWCRRGFQWLHRASPKQFSPQDPPRRADQRTGLVGHAQLAEPDMPLGHAAEARGGHAEHA